MKTIADILKKTASQPTDKGIHFIRGEEQVESISYRQLYSDSLVLLAGLNQKGITPGSEVVIQAHSDLNFVKIFWACILGRIIPVPVTFGMNESIINKVSKVMETLNHPFIVTDVPGYAEKIERSFNKRFFEGNEVSRIIDLTDLDSAMPPAVPLEAEENDIAFLQFSSGSTDNPKGVTNTHKAILQNVLDLSADDYDPNIDDSTLGWMPLTHDMGIISFHIMPMYHNVNQYLIPPMLFMAKPHLWMDAVARYKITVTGSPNFGFAYYLKNCRGYSYPVGSFSQLRILISGAEQINHAVCEDFLKELEPFGMGQSIFRPTYGLAEATLYVTGKRTPGPIPVCWLNRNRLNTGDPVEMVDEQDEQAVCFVALGRPQSTAIEIRDTDNKPLPERHVGCIHIKGPCITRGYYNNPAATQAVIGADGWLNTGDLGFLTDGQLVVTGRVKELIIHRGQNYYPNDIDNAVYANPWIKDRQVATCGIYNSRLKQDDVVVFITHSGPVKEFVPLIQSVRKIVYTKTGVEVSRVVPVEHLPKTTSGKVQRFRLREDFLQGAFDAVTKEIASVLLSYKPNQLTIPRNEIEKKIVAIIARHLNVEAVNVRDNFFDIGASSMIVQAIKADLEEEFSMTIDDIALYKYPNVRAFSGYVNEILSSRAAPAFSERAGAFADAKERLRRK